jgi:hypothetical protein
LADNITLRQRVLEFLDDNVLSKAPEERTRRDEQLLEHGRAFADVLLRHEGLRDSEPQEHEVAVTRLLRASNEINREYDLRGVEAEALAVFRKPAR